MAALVNVALFLILGVLQVSSGEYKDIQIGKVECEANCCDENFAICGKIGVRILRLDGDHKIKGIKKLQDVLEAIQQCCCGKEHEEKKCLLENVFPKLQDLEGALSEFFTIYGASALEAMANITLRAMQAENELRCYCKSECCAQKYEVPKACYKIDVKECKAENCACSVNLLPKMIPEQVSGLVEALEVQKQIIASCENLEKLKEYYPKGGKCNNEKGLAALINEITTVRKYAAWLTSRQAYLTRVVQSTYNNVVLALGEILFCPVSTKSKSCGSC